MTKNIQSINPQKILFIDTESVRKTKELDPESNEFKLYQYKIRDRETDELPSVEDTLEDYRKRAPLRFPYSKIVTISIGYINNGTIIVKNLKGTEAEMIQELYEKASNFTHICGVNILEWDMPLLRTRLSTFMSVIDVIPDRFNDSGKKPWNLGSIIDIFDIYKGTHRYNPSFNELCMLYGVKSPKEGSIEGSQVSDAYYDGRISEIQEYCTRDVVASINVFLAMTGRDQVHSVVERAEEEQEEEQEENLLEKLYTLNEIVDLKDKFLEKLQGKKITDAEKEQLREILLGVYIRTDFANFDQDNKEIKAIKAKEIDDLIKEL